VDSFDMERITTAGHSIKRHVRLPTDHIERLLEEACPNHAYPIKYKLRDCGTTKNLMFMGSLTWDMEPEEEPGERDVTPFTGEDVVMMVYGRHTLWGGVARPS
jgi:hypothetical protein